MVRNFASETNQNASGSDENAFWIEWHAPGSVCDVVRLSRNAVLTDRSVSRVNRDVFPIDGIQPGKGRTEFRDIANAAQIVRNTVGIDVAQVVIDVNGFRVNPGKLGSD